jgi:hypothetical protein
LIDILKGADTGCGFGERDRRAAVQISERLPGGIADRHCGDNTILRNVDDLNSESIHERIIKVEIVFYHVFECFTSASANNLGALCRLLAFEKHKAKVLNS